MTTKATATPVAQKLYKRYEYLAEAYARKLFNFERLGMERADVVQEFKLKIYSSIINFAKRWAKYKETGKYKPIPLPYFIKHNLNTLIMDMSKRINQYYVDVNGVSHQRITGISSIQDMGFDIGVTRDTETFVDLEDNKVVIKGVDFLGGLNRQQTMAFKMHLKGYNLGMIRKIVWPKAVRGVVEDPALTIARQTARLQERRAELLATEEETFFSFTPQEEA